MISDHFGMMFFPDYGIFRIVGRIAFILYAFMLVEGYFHTKNQQKYLGKLFIWALISEIPFDLANYGKIFYPIHQNIFWTLFLSSIGIHFLEKNKELGLKTLTCLVILFLALIFRVDYNIYGILIIWTFYYAKKLKFNYIIPIIVLSISAGLFLNKFQFFAPLGLILVFLYNGITRLKNRKYLLLFLCLTSFSFWNNKTTIKIVNYEKNKI